MSRSEKVLIVGRARQTILRRLVAAHVVHEGMDSLHVFLRGDLTVIQGVIELVNDLVESLSTLVGIDDTGDGLCNGTRKEGQDVVDDIRQGFVHRIPSLSMFIVPLENTRFRESLPCS